MMRMDRSTRTGLRLQNMTTGLLAGAILLLAAYASHRYPVRWDWTMDSRNSLVEQSVKAAQSFPDGSLTATVYVQENSDTRKLATDLLDKYRTVNTSIKIHYIDPDLDPAATRNAEVTTYGTVILRAKDKSEKVTELSEEQVTNALIRLAKGEKKTIRFLTGHGEHSLGGDDKNPAAKQDRNAYSKAVALLKGEGYAVEELNLVAESAIPEQTAALVLAGPRKKLLPMEIERIQEWLAKGNSRLFVMNDPGTESGLEPMLKKMGVVFTDGIVIDLSARLLGAGPTTPLVTKFDDTHPATKSMTSLVILPEARGVELEEQPLNEGKTTRTRLLSGADKGWLETGDIRSGTVEFNPDKDRQGPIQMGVAVEREKQRLVAIGDSDFVSDTYAGVPGNTDLFLNLVRWLAEDENFIAIKPKPVLDSGLHLQQGGGMALFFGLVIAIPLGLATAGVVIWSRRKRL